MKPIAVPVRTKGRSATPQHARTAHSSLSIRPVVVSQLPASEPHPRHQFRVGQRLKMTSGGNLLKRVGSMVTVLQLQPHDGGELRYRVRSDLEHYERVVVESQLSIVPIEEEE